MNSASAGSLYNCITSSFARIKTFFATKARPDLEAVAVQAVAEGKVSSSMLNDKDKKKEKKKKTRENSLVRPVLAAEQRAPPP